MDQTSTLEQDTSDEKDDILPDDGEQTESGQNESKDDVSFIDEPGSAYRFFAFIWEILKIVLIALAIIIPVRYLLVQPFYVNGESMMTNFQNGNYVLINEFN